MSIIASIRKNSREEIRVAHETFKGHELISIRIWFEADDGSMRPGKAGITIRPSVLPEIIVALSKAAEAGRER